MQEEYAWFENAIHALERALQGQITIVDNQGLFHTPAGKLIFPLQRQSHRKQPVCDCGFSQRCVDFCRHEMNRECLRHGRAFTKTCWKGLTEIVVPLRRGGRHWGMFYLGVWRSPGAKPMNDDGLPEEFERLHAALPRWNGDSFRKLAPLLEPFALGITARLSELNAVGQPPLDRAGCIRDYIERHAGSPEAGIGGLARELHLSESRASRLVHEYFGRGCASLLHEERIRRAKVLLLSTTDKLAAVAAATGFCDEYHFSKVFRKLTGIPPGRFRRGAPDRKKTGVG